MAHDRTEAASAEVLRRFEKSGTYKEDGALSMVASLRRALAARDHGCVFEGCDRPAAWTDGHHLIFWGDGGPTTLDNLALVCRQHHRKVHEEGWRLERRKDGGFAAIPPPRRIAAPRSVSLSR